jgi:hypothetical protein
VVIALIAGRAGEIAAARNDAAQAAASAEPDFRSQPNLPDEPLAAAVAPPPGAAAADEVLLRPRESVPVPVPAESPPVDAALAAAAAAAAAPAAVQAAPRVDARRGYPPKPQRKPRPRRPRTAAEKDFLEREGYIY